MKKAVGYLMVFGYWGLMLIISLISESIFYTAGMIFFPMIMIPWIIIEGFFSTPSFSIMSIMWLILGFYLAFGEDDK